MGVRLLARADESGVASAAVVLVTGEVLCDA